jgi:hypothetical protein
MIRTLLYDPAASRQTAGGQELMGTWRGTIVMAIFVPLSFMAGVYGMNFENMPELQLRYAYFALLGVMAAVAAGLLFTFHRPGWLRGN